jgi:hypothetical protein
MHTAKEEHMSNTLEERDEMTKYDQTAQSFVDAINMKSMPQLGYVLVKKDKGLFWESACGIENYPANEETRKNTGLYRWATVSADGHEAVDYELRCRK